MSDCRAPAPPALELSQVERVYNPGLPSEVRVLRGASLRLMPGEVAALTAPSGAGKSTLLHIAGLLDRPDAGEVTLAGTPTAGLSDARRTALRRRAVGFVYQFHHLLQEFPAEDNVALPMLAEGAPRRGPRPGAPSSGLGGAGGSRRRIARRSCRADEQQRVALCRGLANRPAVLLADEPTGNLDPDCLRADLRHADRAGARRGAGGAGRHARPGRCRAHGPRAQDRGGGGGGRLRRGALDLDPGAALLRPEGHVYADRP
jgi:lipoprotein-releasing system ATP-binding protein